MELFRLIRAFNNCFELCYKVISGGTKAQFSCDDTNFLSIIFETIYSVEKYQSICYKILEKLVWRFWDEFGKSILKKIAWNSKGSLNKIGSESVVEMLIQLENSANLLHVSNFIIHWRSNYLFILGLDIGVNTNQ